MNFGQNLRNFRKKYKMSQEVLAHKLGVSRQAVSRWEVGEAYPEMSNIVALCSIFKCNINDLINDTIVDIESFDKETKEEVVKFKKEQQRKMKFISKSISVIANIVRILIFVSFISYFVGCFIFPLKSNTFEIDENQIKILNKKYDYSINGDIITFNNNDYHLYSSTNLNEFIKSHDNSFFIMSIEYILICETVLTALSVLALHYLYKLYKNICNGNTPFTLENEKIIEKTYFLFLFEMILQKITVLIYSFVAKLDLAIDLNIKDVIVVLIGVSTIYIFKYGRMIQADTKAKIYN